MLENGGGVRKGRIAVSDPCANRTLSEGKRKGRCGGSVLDSSELKECSARPSQDGALTKLVKSEELGVSQEPGCLGIASGSVVVWEQLWEAWSLHKHQGEFRAAAGALGHLYSP